MASLSDFLVGLQVYQDDAYGFCVDILEVNPSEQQKEVLDSVSRGDWTAVKSGRGIGKSAVACWIGIWFLLCNPHSRVVVTAPTKDQLEKNFSPEMHKWITRNSLISELFDKAKTKYNIKGKEHWQMTLVNSNRPENVQGAHGEGGELIIVDEASGLKPEIYEAIVTSMTSSSRTCLLLIGNPNFNYGPFYDAFTKNAELFSRFTFSCERSNNVSKETLKKWEKMWPRDSDTFRINVLGEFPLGDPDAFIPKYLVEMAIQRQPYELPIEVLENKKATIGVDPARYGSDSTAIMGGMSGKVMFVRKVDGRQDGSEVCKHIFNCVDFLRMHGCKGEIDIFVDSNGVGVAVEDLLRQRETDMRIKVKAVNGAWKGDRRHSLVRDALWGNLKDILLEGSICLPDLMDMKTSEYRGWDEDILNELIEQLIVRKYDYDLKSRVLLETKDEMKKRKVCSPDLADALTLMFWNGIVNKRFNSAGLSKFARMNFKGGM